MQNRKYQVFISSTYSDLVEERKQARENKDWAKSDELRDLITSKGYSIKDTKDGIIVKKEI